MYNLIDLLIVEDSEDISQIGEVEIEKITILQWGEQATYPKASLF